MRFLVMVAAALWAIAASAQDARRIVEPLDPAIIDNATIVEVVVTAADTAKPAVEKFDSAAAKKAARAAKARPAAASDDLAILPFAEMFPKVMKATATEFHLDGARRIKLAVSIETIKQPNGFMAFVAVSSEQIAGLVEIFDADDGRPLGIFHIDVINSYGGGFGFDALARGAPREFLAREFSREAVRVLAGRKAREKPPAGPAPSAPAPAATPATAEPAGTPSAAAPQ
jgi:hypothetical protein